MTRGTYEPDDFAHEHTPRLTRATHERAPLRAIAVMSLLIGCVTSFVMARVLQRDDARITDTHGQVGLVWSLNADPTAGGGLAAPLWQFLIRTDVPSLYYKSGTANTAWTKLGDGAAGGGNVTGAGTTNTLPIWTGAHALGDSVVTFGAGDIDVAANLSISSPGTQASMDTLAVHTVSVGGFGTPASASITFPNAQVLRGTSGAPVGACTNGSLALDNTGKAWLCASTSWSQLGGGGAGPSCGDGSDGNVTIAADTTLSRDMFYDALVIDVGKKLKPNGFRIYAKTSITLNGNIDGNGNPGASTAGGGAAGVAIAAGTLPANSSGGGGNSNGSGFPGVAGLVTFLGYDGAGGAGGTVGAGAPGGVGAGGGGGGDFGLHGGAGGIAGTAMAANLGTVRQVQGAIDAASIGANGVTLLGLNTGGGGGGGASAEVSNAGGGGGASGQYVVVCSPSFLGVGTIEAKGGDGGAGTSTFTFGGGGGGGGVIVLVRGASSVAPATSVAGGAGGAGRAAGAAGGDGLVLSFAE